MWPVTFVKRFFTGLLLQKRGYVIEQNLWCIVRALNVKSDARMLIMRNITSAHNIAELLLCTQSSEEGTRQHLLQYHAHGDILDIIAGRL